MLNVARLNFNLWNLWNLWIVLPPALALIDLESRVNR
jgi:hypothetical protein